MAKQADIERAQARARSLDPAWPAILDEAPVPAGLRLDSIARGIAAGGLPTYRLCYVDRPWAYFTTAPVVEQWGDDWNDAPYEHNAGTPYEYRPGMNTRPYDLIQVAFDCFMLETPAELARGNSLWSVKRINRLETPWLSSVNWSPKNGPHHVWAGATIDQLVYAVEAMDGAVYFRRPR